MPFKLTLSTVDPDQKTTGNAPSPAPTRKGTGLQTTVDVDKNTTGNIEVTPPRQAAQEVKSQTSVETFHSTLFEDFGLTAKGLYNFYTDDEQTSFNGDTSLHLNEIPRYVEVKWNTTPVIRVLTPKTKGVKPKPDGIKTSAPKAALLISDAKNSVSNGYVSHGVVAALLVNPVIVPATAKFNEDLFLSSPSSAGKSASDSMDKDLGYHSLSLPAPTSRIRVNFVDPSIAGALSQERIAVATDQTHLSALASFSKLAAGLEVVSEFNQDISPKNPPPVFTAPIETPGLLYTGYVIERYTLDNTGTMTLSRTIDIDDPEQNRFFDREVVFGGRYVYRIKSIVQWSHDKNVSFYGTSVIDRLPKFDSSQISLQSIVSFYSGDWSDWSRTEVVDNLLPFAPDEIIVRPISHKSVIHVNWKMPNNPQRDISSVKLLRAKFSGGRYSDWEQLIETIPTNGMYVDNDVGPFEETNTSYMYTMYSLSYHGEHSTLSEAVEARLGAKSIGTVETPVQQIAIAGADPFTHAAGAAVATEKELVAASKTTFYIRGAKSSLPLANRNYSVEIQSISTGERVDFPLAVNSTDVNLTSDGVGRRA